MFLHLIRSLYIRLDLHKHDICRSEILGNESQNNIVFDIREELMTMVANKCYESYLSKQTVRFTAKATYLAWKQLFQWAYIRHDPVEDKYEDNPKWTPDQPPECSVRDTWAGYATPIIKLPKMEDKYVSVCDGDFKDPYVNKAFPFILRSSWWLHLLRNQTYSLCLLSFTDLLNI